MIYTIEKRHVFGCYDGSYMQSHYEVIAHTHRLPNGCLASTGALTVHTCKYKREATAYCKAHGIEPQLPFISPEELA